VSPELYLWCVAAAYQQRQRQASGGAAVGPPGSRPPTPDLEPNPDPVPPDGFAPPG
jgi:hypothetical protein